MIGALDVGGSHACAGLVDLAGRRLLPGSRVERRYDPHADRVSLLDAILGVARGAASTSVAGPPARWGVAAPGPFDYAAGRCTIRGQAKLDALYGVELRAELAATLGLADPATVRFGNDADAFLIGEWWAGAARGAARAAGITLGTGLGSAFLAGGQIVASGDQVPPEGRLDLLPFRGAPVERVVSARGLRAACGQPTATGPELAAAARASAGRCRDAFADLGRALGTVLRPWLSRFRPSCLVIGGGMSAAWDLIEPSFRRHCPPAGGRRVVLAAHPGDAALLGAAFAARLQRSSVDQRLDS